MTNKLIIIFSVLIVFSLVFSTSALAKDFELPKTGITPDSPFYFLKAWKESIQTFFTFNTEQKAKQYLHLAEVRLAEYQKMLEKGKEKIAEKTLTKYQNQLNRALSKVEELKNKGKDVKDLTQQIQEVASKYKEPKACTQEAKQCPDGSSVSRTGLNCEFAECPEETKTPSITVLSPNRGETWEIGKTYKIKWSGEANPSTGKIFIGLRDKRYSPVEPRGESTITIITENTGSYDFNIPVSLGSLSGGKLGGEKVYTIVVYGVGFDQSDAAFSIVAAGD
ncbi:MAG: hypothetical protein HY773_00825 [Candidatus Terrybacteria bacterium]|nr:hypothetical protein [Candidatus Terrybacteria bacterium]